MGGIRRTMRITMMCLRNLLRRRLRTSLCILGIVLATMFIVVIGATTGRYVSVIKEMNMFFSGDVVVVPRGAFVIYGFPIAGIFLEDVADEVRTVNGVETAVPLLFIIASNSEGSFSLVPTNVSIGVSAGEWEVLVGSTPLKPGGSWPSANSSDKEVVVGNSLSDQYDLTVGSKIEIKNYELRVVGILEAQSALLTRAIIMPLKLAQEVYGYNMLINMVVVEPKEGVPEEEIANRIELEIGSTKALTSDERNEIIEPLLSDVETWNLGIRSVLFFLSMILVTMVAMINVSERRRDFATLDAIGAPKSSIFRMVITETALIGLFGGLAGILFGSVAAVYLTSVYTTIPVSVIFPGLFYVVSPTMMIEILASTVAVSCVAGIIPAITATRMTVAEVLRSEY
jgi:putative ABC transport system permease protein